MNTRYIGHLSHDDPLDGYLRFDIAPQTGFHGTPAGFRVFQFEYSRDVYLYEESNRAFKVVGKFHPPERKPRPNQVRPPTEIEYRNLIHLRNLGLDTPPLYVVQPLGYNAYLNNLLVVEYVGGVLLSRVIEEAILQGRRNRLYRKLSALADFLAVLHNRTAGDWTVDFGESCGYMARLIESLRTKRGLGHDQAEELYHLREVWRSRDMMWADHRVIVHGDATPSNFKFGRGRDVLAIDLERMTWSDRVFDLGRLAGELKHFFFRATGDVWAAEPFIGHFLWEYCGHFPDRERTFRSITQRLPFYLGITLLRIARNSWVDWGYRRQLIHESVQVLRGQA